MSILIATLSLSLLAGQDRRINPTDPIVEPGMRSMQLIELNGRTAGFGSGRDVSLKFHQVTSAESGAEGDSGLYWMVRYEIRSQRPTQAEETTSLWIDSRRCPAVNVTLDRLMHIGDFQPYPPTEGRYGLSALPHGEYASLVRLGRIGAMEVRQTIMDRSRATLGPILQDAEAALEPCVEEAVPTATTDGPPRPRLS